MLRDTGVNLRSWYLWPGQVAEGRDIVWVYKDAVEPVCQKQG